jgi:hypothetical protein
LAFGYGSQAFQQGAMAEMDAIEVADGQCRGLGGRTRKTAKNEHQGRRVAGETEKV